MKPAAERSSADDPARAALQEAIGFQYEISRLLGRGGMGAVYQAHEKALDRPVAIKVLPPDAAIGDARERFLREARTAARLTHPNIVPLLTFGETHGIVYYVMGYVEGESLEQRLRRAGPIDPETATQLLCQLADALAYAHSQGVVHRDVKPDNVLIERSTGVAKLTDFGIAKRTAGGETLTGTGLLLGTPRYMSPEQASGDRDLDARSDIYSLGLVGYAMLTGRPPFDGSSVQEILTQQVTRDAPSLRKLLPDLPGALSTSIERALKKDSSLRWADARTMAAALREEDDDEGQLTQRTMRKPGRYAVANAAITWASFNVCWYVATNLKSPLLYWVIAAMPLGFLVDWWTLRWKEKLSLAETRRVFTEPPKWWPFWWRARWRRSDDVWTRLPGILRLPRVLTSTGIAAFAVSVQSFFMAFTLGKTSPFMMPLMMTGLAMLPISLAGLVGGVLAVERIRRKFGVTRHQANRLGTAPTGNARFWRQDWVAPFLTASRAPETLEPRTPAALADAIDGIVGRLAGPQRESVGPAAGAATALASAIDRLDAEIATLVRSADPAEIERLEQRIASLGAPSVSDNVGQREMRQLYTSQLDLLRRLLRQREELASKRARYLELLRTLWLQLSTLRAGQAADAMSIDDVTGRVRHIVESVERDVAGARDVEGLLRGTSTVGE